MEAQKDKKISISRRVINAILKLQKGKGVSLVDLKKYLRNEKNLDVEKYNEEIKLALKSGLDGDKLTRVDGLYKVKESKRNRDKGAGTKERGQSKSRGKRSKTKSPAKKRSPSRKKAAKALLVDN